VNRVTIAGIGNILAGDDGIGPYIARVLEAEYDFENAQIADLGTPVLDFPDHLDGSKTILIIDAVENRKAPGTITVYTTEHIVKHGVPVRTDPHSPALAEMLMRSDFTGVGPTEAVLVGITAKSCEYYEPISDEVKRAVPDAIAEVLRQAENLGIRYEKKPHPADPAIWWDTAVDMAGAR
jgi:hydrogenase maturation protease